MTAPTEPIHARGNAEDLARALQSQITVTHLEISVWDIVNGDVVKKVWDGSWDEYDGLCDEYDDGMHQVVIDREWEEAEDEE